MIRTPFLGKMTALTMALAAHGGLAFVLTAQAHAPMIEGSGGAAEVRLGNSFQDMAAGTLSAQEPPEDNILPATQAVPVPLAQPQPDRILAAAPTQMAAPAMTDGALPVPSGEAAPAEPAETLSAEEPDSLAVTESERPKPRRKAPPARQKPATQPVSQAKPAPAAPAGNAAQQTRAGEAAGKPDATATRSGSGGSQQAAGNAAANNYPGVVMKKLSRAGKPNVSARGSAIVAFSIADSGALASVSLARSSGSSELDQAALRLVQSAAPFPAPPHGARRNLSIEIKGR